MNARIFVAFRQVFGLTKVFFKGICATGVMDSIGFYLLAFFPCLPKNAAIIFIAHFLLTKNYQTHNEITDTLLGDIPLQEK